MNILEEKFGVFDNFEYRPRNPLYKSINALGLNDAPFVLDPTIEGRRVKHPAYSVWINMLNRCHSHSLKGRNPTYTGVLCCKEWLLFTNFAIWFKCNYIKDHQLDKDILIKGNKIYSPNTCVFVPQNINKFLTLRGVSRGELPIGVVLRNSKFQALISKNSSQKYLGTFASPGEAHKAWQKAKLEQAIAFNFPPLQRVIDQLTYEIENNLETISL